MAKVNTKKKVTTVKLPEEGEKQVDQKKALQSLVNSMCTKFGKNALTVGFPEVVKESNSTKIKTGSFALDIALGGGIPLGRYTEISGAYSSTKTTQALHILRNAQLMGLQCAFSDVEGTTDKEYMQKLDIDADSVIYSNPDGMEEATQAILDMQKSGLVHFAILDSIASLSPNKEQETDMDESMRMGIPQTLLGEFFRKYQASNNRLVREGKTPFTLIGINQLREKIGAYGD
jgi:recombination protein RecA